MNDTLHRLLSMSDSVTIETVWGILHRLLSYPSATGAAGLDGAVGEPIAAIASELGYSERLHRNFRNTGNIAISYGAEKEPYDLVVTAHMDRPAFRVWTLGENVLYPICANRFNYGEYRVGAKALRFIDGRITVVARGTMISNRHTSGDQLKFELREGEFAATDTFVLDVGPQRDGAKVIGTGLDNSLGVTILLETLRLLSALENDLKQADQSILFVFTDFEEGPPDGVNFGLGAARLTYAIAPPTLGVVNVDAHNADGGGGIVLGEGASHGFVSGMGKGTIVNLAHQATAQQLAAEVNASRAGTVKVNAGYISRSDDIMLTRWSPILGLVGVPMLNAHTGDETADLGDLVNGVRWLSVYLTTLLTGA